MPIGDGGTAVEENHPPFETVFRSAKKGFNSYDIVFPAEKIRIDQAVYCWTSKFIVKLITNVAFLLRWKNILNRPDIF